MTDTEIINYLSRVSFSTLEAKIYTTLIKEGELSCYQIAKKINISRSSVYAAIEPMYEKGYVLCRTETKQVYTAQQPEILFAQLRCSFSENARLAENALKEIYNNKEEDIFTNVKGLDSIIASTKEMINSAEKEIYINFDFMPKLFEKEFRAAINRGVRIIIFTFAPLDILDMDIELYSHNCITCTDEMPSRIMIVKDYSLTLVADKKKNCEQWFGTFTNNHLLVDIISEHIHHDIYMLKLQEQQNKALIDDTMCLHTLLENRDIK